MDSLQVTDDASAAVAVAPRVALADITAKIAHVFYARGDSIVDSATETEKDDVASPLDPADDVSYACRLLTVCIVVMQNGFIVIGKAVPASPENFNVDLGRNLAYEDAVRQLWPLEGYLLRETLHQGGH